MLILVSAEITVVSWLRKEEKVYISLLQTLSKTFEFRHHLATFIFMGEILSSTLM